MKLTTSVKDLSSGLAVAKKALDAKAPIPVLAGVHVDATVGWDRVILTTTDLDRTVRVVVPADVTKKGVGVVGHAVLDKLVKGADKTAPISLAWADDEVVFSEADTTSTVMALPRAEFPAIAPVDPRTKRVPLDTTAIGYVLSAAHVGADMPVIATVYFDGDEIAATDRFRLHVTRLPEAHGFHDLMLPAAALAPALTLTDATMRVGEHEAWIEAGPVTWMIRRPDPELGKYPPYRRLLPERLDRVVEVDPHALRTVVEKVGVLVTDKETPVRVTLADRAITVEAETREVGTSRSKPVPINVIDTPGGDFTIGFNPAFLARLLDYPRDVTTVTVGFDTPLRPAVFGRTDDDGRYDQRLLMPVKLLG